MKLLLDIGNSRIKWAVTDDGPPSGHDSISLGNGPLPGLLVQTFDDIEPPSHVVIANVAGARTGEIVSGYFHDRHGLVPQFLETGRSFDGLENSYADTGRLGIDRWAAMVAAWVGRHAALCVVSCGTAVTVDLVTPAGKHAGGYIIPGLSLMRESLAGATDAIGIYPASIPATSPGTSTPECVHNGTARAVVSLIESSVDYFRSTYGEAPAVFITGGEASLINQFLGAGHVIDQTLVLKGLAILSGKPA